MKRDWDVIRLLLIKIESLPSEASEYQSTELIEADAETTAYHMRLMLEAGLIVGSCRDALGPAHCRASRLTWMGHELLDAIRRESIWQQVKTRARKQSVDLSLDLIKAAAKALISDLMAG